MSIEEFGKKLREAADKKVKEIRERREEILVAFIAKYGCSPEQIIEVMGKCECGADYWMVVEKKDHSYELGKFVGYKEGYAACQNEIKRKLDFQ